MALAKQIGSGRLQDETEVDASLVLRPGLAREINPWTHAK